MQFTTGVLAVALIAPSAAAQITSTTVDIGGPNTKGLQSGDPPMLSDGSAATATMTYSFDSSTGELTIEVANTTPQTAGEANPVLNEVYFNVPYLAVTSMTFDGQSSTAAVQPTFTLNAIDLDADALPNPNHIGGFGTFNVCFAAPARMGIANPTASMWGVPTTDLVMGSVVFAFTVVADNMSSLSAVDFATSPSFIPPGDKIVTAAAKFQAGGVGGSGSGFIGTSKDCRPGLWLAGKPCIGETITFVLSGDRGCHYCIIGSVFITPYSMFGIDLAFSPPLFVLTGGTVVNSTTHISIPIPPFQSLIGWELGFAGVSLNGLTLVATESIVITVCE